MKKVFITIIILAAVVAAGYFVWKGRDRYFFQGEENFEVDEETVGEEDELDDLDEEENKPMTEEEKKEEEKEKKLDDLDEEEMSLVTASDCDNECEDWKDDDDNLEICQEICGLRNDENDSDENCEDLEDTEADICFRREAIEKKDFSICEKIDDDSLKKNCENRVAEEILDDQQ